jgi:hypothetical protein
MGAFIGYDEVGVWATNAERDAFLDWFAENRCVRNDSHWEYCKSIAMPANIDFNENKTKPF